jgi:hypothetical protein
MSAIAILTGLLVVAYFGSILVGGRALRGFGLPSGTEFLLLGIILGPSVFGVISGATLAAFEPLTVIALAWTSLVLGIHFGRVGERRVSSRRLALGAALALATLMVTAGATFGVAYALTPLRGNDLWVLALGAGCVASETTRHAVRWVAERYKAEGPVASLLGDLAEADDIVPLVGLGLVFALGDVPQGLHIHFPAWLSFASTLAVGGVLGATASALSDIEERVNEQWGILLGTALLGMGAVMRLGQSAPSAMFAMGLTLSGLSKRAPALREMLEQTERPLMLPVLVLAGAQATIPKAWPLIAIGVTTLGARFAAKLVVGAGLRKSLVEKSAALAGRLGPGLGLALMPSGLLSITIGLSCALRFPGQVGQTILTIATVSGLVGEAVGPVKLKTLLEQAGELSDDAPVTAPPPTKSSSIPPPRSRLPSRGSRKSLPPPPRRPQSSPEGRRT